MGALDAERLAKLLAAILEMLPAADIAEIEAFIDKVVQRTREADEWAQRMTKVSEPSFAAVWDNPEDAIYDEL